MQGKLNEINDEKDTNTLSLERIVSDYSIAESKAESAEKTRSDAESNYEELEERYQEAEE